LASFWGNLGKPEEPGVPGLGGPGILWQSKESPGILRYGEPTLRRPGHKPAIAIGTKLEPIQAEPNWQIYVYIHRGLVPNLRI